MGNQSNQPRMNHPRGVATISVRMVSTRLRLEGTLYPISSRSVRINPFSAHPFGTRYIFRIRQHNPCSGLDDTPDILSGRYQYPRNLFRTQCTQIEDQSFHTSHHETELLEHTYSLPEAQKAEEAKRWAVGASLPQRPEGSPSKAAFKLALIMLLPLSQKVAPLLPYIFFAARLHQPFDPFAEPFRMPFFI